VIADNSVGLRDRTTAEREDSGRPWSLFQEMRSARIRLSARRSLSKGHRKGHLVEYAKEQS
jgi:hypothetical protein